jgi:hypothetical protein
MNAAWSLAGKLIRIDVPKDLFHCAPHESGNAMDRHASNENFFMASAIMLPPLTFLASAERLRDHRLPASSKT